MAFDPDAYLAKSSPGFDPDAYLGAKPPPEVKRGESAARGALQGVTLGWGDEAAAALGAALPFLEPEAKGETFSERYRTARDYFRGRNAAAERAAPATYAAGQLAGAVAPTMVGAAPVAGGRALAIAAGQGAAQGAGYSDAEDAASLASDTALGGALGTAGYGAGKVLGQALSSGRRAAGRLARSARSRAATAGAREAVEELASETGRVGGFQQDTNRQIEWIIRLLDEERSGMISPANRAALEAFRKSPEYATVVNHAAEQVLQKAPASVQRTIAQQSKVQALQQALPQTIKTRTEQLLTPQVGADAKSFLKAYAEPLVWAYGANKAGEAAGMEPGNRAALAAAAGVIGGRTRAGKALYNRVNRPAHQLAVAEALRRNTSGTRAEALRRALAAGGPAVATDSDLIRQFLGAEE